MNIRLTKQQKTELRNSEDVYKIMQQVLLRENQLQRNQEHFWIIGLSATYKILFIELLALGQDNRVHIKPPQVFRMAIYKNAPQVIFIHNHPSGIIEPSKQDLLTTDRLLKSGEIIEIDIIDHIIISEIEYFSFKKAGLIEQLKKSGAYEVVSSERAELEKIHLQFEKDRAIKEAKIEVAKKMLAKNVSPDEVKELTGITVRELNKLIKANQKIIKK